MSETGKGGFHMTPEAFRRGTVGPSWIGSLAQTFARWVEESPRFELAAPAPLNLVCFRCLGGDTVSERLLDRLNRSGRVYLTHTRLKDRTTLRFCVGQTNTDERHVSRAWELIQEAAAEIEKEG